MGGSAVRRYIPDHDMNRLQIGRDLLHSDPLPSPNDRYM